MSTIDAPDDSDTPSVSKGNEKKGDGREAQKISREQVPFDYVNLTIVQDPQPEYIQVYVLVPLADGSATETRITLGTPTRVSHDDGKLEYKMVIDSNFSVIPIEKQPTGAVKVVTHDGLSWTIPAGYPGARTALLDHEPLVKAFMVSHFRPEQVFVDAGANVGAYSLRAASLGMEVHSFEPDPENVKILKRNAEINGLSIDVLEFALGSSDGSVSLSQNGAVSKVTEGIGLGVQMRTLDSFNLPKVDLLKVDVEGYELEVLSGAKETLARSHPTMMIEMHHWLGAEKEAALFDILADLGYSFEYLDRYPQGRHLAVTYAE